MMDIQKLIQDAERADAVAALMQDVNPHHVLELADRLKAAEAQLAEQQSITRRVSAESNALHDERNKLRAQLAELAKQEPIYQFIMNRPDIDGYIEWVDCNKNYFDSCGDDIRRIVYAVPPAPVMPDDLAQAFISAIEKEQDRLFDEDYLLDSKDCVDVIREEARRLSASRAAPPERVILERGVTRDVVCGASAHDTRWISRDSAIAAIKAAGGSVADE